MSQITTINPATGQPIRSFSLQDEAVVDATLSAAAKAQRAWAQVPIAERAAVLPRIAAILREGKARYAEMITREMGKPIAESEAEIEKCAWNCDFYAEQGPKWLEDEAVDSSATESAVVFDPLGVVLAIMPWNYPFWQYFRFTAPALVAGNGAILKHANNVPEWALAVQEVIQKAGAPAGLTATLLIDNRQVAGIIADPRVAAVTLTGSTEVGAIVASQAGKARFQIVAGGTTPGGQNGVIVYSGAEYSGQAIVVGAGNWQLPTGFRPQSIRFSGAYAVGWRVDLYNTICPFVPPCTYHFLATYGNDQLDLGEVGTGPYRLSVHR